ncbi:MAG: conjugal transfer protein TraX [Gracilibacteraceae bacterium]|jgi:hypothetical protein|nr:conjugal transfer protein TraX [Gracilibacteraceae bacterium]
MSAFWLKILACLIMLTDHTGAIFPTPYWLRFIGRIAFPLFVYFVAEGCARTRNINRYLFRLGLFALISEIPFDIAFGPSFGGEGVDFLRFTNVFYTLFLGVLAVSVYNGVSAFRRPPVALLPLLLLIPLLLGPPRPLTLALAILYALVIHIVIRRTPAEDVGGENALPTVAARLCALAAICPIIWLADLLGTDYGSFGVVFILVLTLARTRESKLVFLALFIFLEYGAPLLSSAGLDLSRIVMLAVAMLAVPLAAAYNGRRGPSLKWSFYAFYPVHLAALAALTYVI